MSMKVRMHLDVSSSTCPSMECSYGLASRRHLVCVPIYTVVAAKLSSGLLSLDSLDPFLAIVVSLGVSFGTAGTPVPNMVPAFYHNHDTPSGEHGLPLTCILYIHKYINTYCLESCYRYI